MLELKIKLVLRSISPHVSTEIICPTIEVLNSEIFTDTLIRSGLPMLNENLKMLET